MGQYEKTEFAFSKIHDVVDAESIDVRTVFTRYCRVTHQSFSHQGFSPPMPRGAVAAVGGVVVVIVIVVVVTSARPRRLPRRPREHS